MMQGMKNGQQESSMQKTLHILWPFFVWFIVHDMAQMVLLVLMNASLEMFGTDYTLFVQKNEAAVGGILNAMSLLVGMGVVTPMALKELRSVTKQRKQGGITAYGLLVLLAISLAMGMNLLLTFTGLVQASQQYTEVAVRQYGVGFGLGLILYGVISPLAEEVIFRGLIYNRLKKTFRIPLAIVISGLMFGLYHGNIVQGIYGWVLGMMITLVYEWYGSLRAPVLFHGAANLCVFMLSYDAEVYDGLQTPLSLIVCMVIAGMSLWGIIRLRKTMENEGQ